MEVRPGYKQTEFGLIPAEWQVRSFLSVVRPATGQVNPKNEPYRSMVLVAPDHIESESGRLLERKTAAEQDAISGKYLFERGDIVYSKIRPYLRKAILADFQGLCSADMYPLSPAKDVSSAYVLAVLLGHHFSSFAVSASARSGIPKINRQELAEYAFALPPPAEQRAIAAALSDVDALIASLDVLIAKKRALKQAAMQQLLTGQTRLPGFSGEWNAKRLGKIGSFSKGKGIRKDEVVPDGLPCIRYGEIYTHHTDYVRAFFSFIPAGVAKQSQRLRKGDLLFAGSGETAEEIGKCVAFLDDVEAYAGGDIVILSPVGHDSMYLGYLMNHASVAEQKARMGQGDAVVHISARNLARLSVRLPREAEQTAIADVLSDMDAELAALGERLAKTRALKQGMMQELLTGRTRLV